MKLHGKILGKNLFLRSLSAQDANSNYLSWLQDDEVTKYLEIRFNPPSKTANLVDLILKFNSSPDTLMLGIFLNKNSFHLGNIKLGPINYYHKTAEIGLLIGAREEWGKGRGSEAIDLISNYAFEVLDIAKLTAGCYESNMGSRRAFSKVGFKEEGRLISHNILNNQRENAILFGKSNPVINPLKLN